MIKIIKNNLVLALGILAILVFCLVDYNFFGLLDAYGDDVLITLLSFVYVLCFILWMVFRVSSQFFRFIFKKEKIKKSDIYQYVILIVLTLSAWAWLEHRDPVFNSGYSEVFSK